MKRQLPKRYLFLIPYRIKSSIHLTFIWVTTIVFIVGLTLPIESWAQGLTITVNSNDDDDDLDVVNNHVPDKICATAAGKCSLRAAIQTNNGNSRDVQGNIIANTIKFNINLGPRGSVQRIFLATPLPGIGGALTLDGTSQPGYKNASKISQIKPLIELDGTNAIVADANGLPILDPVTGLPLPVTGLTIGEIGTAIKGFHILHFSGWGIAIQPTGGRAENNRIEKNIIGSNTGNLKQGNKSGGILITGTFLANNTLVIDNIIAGNGGPGVEVRDAKTVSPNSEAIKNNIQRNNIYNNVGINPTTGLPDNTIGLGIDLVVQGTPNGVTPNDAPADPDIGPNLLQNFPVSVTGAPSNTRNLVTVVVRNLPLTLYRIDIFASPSFDPSGNGEGQEFLTSAFLVTDGNGLINLQYTTSHQYPKGWVFTATATDPGGNTSEFSPCSTPLAVVSPGTSDLAVVNTANKNSLAIGETIIFTVKITNQGPDAASNITVEDITPTGLTFTRATPSAGSYNDSTGIWSVNALNNGGEATLTIEAVAKEAGPITNTAEILYSDQNDPDSSPNNSANSDNIEDDLGSVSVEVQEQGTPPTTADLELAMVPDKTQVTVGASVSFKITVINKGPAVAMNVAVKDLAPLGFTFGTAVASQGSYSTTTGIWIIGTLNNGSNATLTIPATTTLTGTITNTAEISASGQPDPDSSPNNGVTSEDDQGSVAITVQQVVPTADLELTKKADKASLTAGEVVTFSLTLSNKGPNIATGIKVTDIAPANLHFDQVTASVGSYNTNNGIWSINTLNSGSQAILTVTATPSQPGIIVNKTEVTASDQKDPDSSPNNGVASEDDQSSVSIQVIAAVSIEDQIKQLMNQVDNLVKQNKLNRLHGRVLSELLNISLELYNRGLPRASVLTLRAFILSVNELVNKHQLSRDEGQKLISAAQKIIQLIESSLAVAYGHGITPGLIAAEEKQPNTFKLYPNYPNPFYASTVVSFELGKESKMQLYVYDGSGRLVSALVDRVLPAGKHYVTWQAKSLPAGIYILWFKADKYLKTERMVMIK